ncbi:organomercurial lyase [Rhodocaloribacter sp.]
MGRTSIGASGAPEFRARLIRMLRETMGPEADAPETAAAAVHAARLLAGGTPVAPAEVGASLGWPPERVAAALRRLRAAGQVETDDAGRIVGMAGLTLLPTAHRFEAAGRALYTWCALDALFFPALLGTPAHVSSTCPVTGGAVHLTVTPDAGVTDLAPPAAVVSIPIPEGRPAAPGCGPGACAELFGPGGAFCGNAHFFTSERAAQIWLRDHPRAVTLPAADACALAVEVWAEPLLRQAASAR